MFAAVALVRGRALKNGEAVNDCVGSWQPCLKIICWSVSPMLLNMLTRRENFAPLSWVYSVMLCNLALTSMVVACMLKVVLVSNAVTTSTPMHLQTLLRIDAVPCQGFTRG